MWSRRPPLWRTETRSSRSSAELLVGEIVRPHGIRGEVVLRTHSDNPRRFTLGAEVKVGRTAEDAKPMVISKVRPHGERLLVQLETIDDRSSAEDLAGMLVFAEPDPSADSDVDAYWEHQIVGLTVKDTDGNPLGIIERVIGRKEQDLWEVQTDAGIVQLPAAKDLVLSVDLEAGFVVVDPPAGLFE